MPRYEVDINGKKYEVEAPNEDGVRVAIGQIQGAAPQSQKPSQMDDYYSSGIYAGQYNPLGPVMRSLDAGVAGIGDALTFGFGDEIVSPLDGGAAGDRLKEYKQTNPIATTAGQITGGVLGTGALSAAGVLPSIPQAASLATKVGVGAGEGFGLGALYGLGSGEGNDRATNALISGGLGAVGGAAVPLVAQGVSSAYRNVMDRAAQNQVARDAGVSPEVARQLAQTLDADATLGPAGRANMSVAGQEAMLADAGPNARMVLDTAIQRGGPGAVLARNRIDQRVGRDSVALNNALNSALGVPEGATAARTAIREASSDARRAAYNAAYEAPIDYADPRGQALQEMLQSRVPGGTIAEANRLMQLGGHSSRQIHADIAPDGSITYQTLPDVRQIDYITRALNQAASTGEGQGALGGQTALGNAYEGLSRDIRGNLRGLVEPYATALDTAADPIRRSQAVDLGSRLLSPGLRRDQLAEAVDGYSEAERNALAQGVRSYIDDTIANVTRTVQDGSTDAREAYKAIRDLSSRANRDKLTTALGAARAQPLFNELDRVSQSFNLRGAVAENSKTFARQATNEMLREGASPGIIGTAGRGEGINATKRIIQALTGQTDEAIRGRENAIASEIADYLTRPAAQAIPAFQAMQNYQGQTLANQLRANTVSRILSAPNLAVYPVAGQSADRIRR